MLRRKEGGTLVESALLFVLFITLIFAIIDFGLYFFIQHTVQFATREGVRLALVGRTIERDGTQLDRTQSILTTIRENAAIAIDPSQLDIRIYPVTNDYSDPGDWDQRDPDAGAPWTYMRVRTRYNHHLITPFFGDGQKTVEAEATYRNELFD
jgi:hypothetical protein